MAAFRIPAATYRIQFHGGFRFSRARAIVAYLHDLGITDLYASPLLRARRGSTHGYDVTDPLALNPELGTEQAFDALVSELKRHGLGLLLDIVPNHMAVGEENPWWMDLLENGDSSSYAAFFDRGWSTETRLILPVLGRPYRECRDNQEIALSLDADGFHIRYYERRFPVDPSSYDIILEHERERWEKTLAPGARAPRALKGLIAAVKALRKRQKGDRNAQQKRAIKQTLQRLYRRYPAVKKFLDQNIKAFNATRRAPESFALLDKLLSQQAYELVFWREAAKKISYRRFFDITDLVGVRVEDPHVFAKTHSLILGLIRKRKVTGLRIDHIDGLYDPFGYLRRLQSAITRGGERDFYVLAEKILSGNEPLRLRPLSGTTGYEYMNQLNRVFVDSRGLKSLGTIYIGFAGARHDFEKVYYRSKKLVASSLFGGEVSSLTDDLSRLERRHGNGRLGREQLKRALVAVSVAFPVYRTYTRGFNIAAQDRAYIEQALNQARRLAPTVNPAALRFLGKVLLLDTRAERTKQEFLFFVRRWQQFTGPLMAKGFEDTTLYNYNHLLSLNDVGGEPAPRKIDLAEFHRANRNRKARWPYGMNATSTHDTKRSEDVRARLNVLSEIPERWQRCLERWSRWNRTKKDRLREIGVPEPNVETLMYQNLLGGWPLDPREVKSFKERFKGYMIKAMREAKGESSWLYPNDAYETAVTRFAERILEPSADNRFLNDFLQLQKDIALYGALNSLAQVVLKAASPGVPDFYQGTELWDFSLTDPDNRRPVDFAKRVRVLRSLRARAQRGVAALLRELLTRWSDGRIKFYVTYRAVNLRRQQKDLFLNGDYLPLKASSAAQGHLCAFMRRRRHQWALVVVPRLCMNVLPPGKFPMREAVWGKHALFLTPQAPRQWLNIFTEERLEVSHFNGRPSLPLAQIFHQFPVALLTGE